MDKNKIDTIKVVVAFIAIIASNDFLEAAFPNRTEEELEIDEIRRYIILIVRAIIIVFSVKYDVSLSACVTLSLFITIWVIIWRLNIGSESEES